MVRISHRRLTIKQINLDLEVDFGLELHLEEELDISQVDLLLVRILPFHLDGLLSGPVLPQAPMQAKVSFRFDIIHISNHLPTGFGGTKRR
jgi:hypothetical protein